ncbi:copper homeostasis protein CutC [Pelagibacterium mangrovi]|uniref:copper homeostasis protein CutC n=1 Tax=Pelagibacterium mangrovi TaxID=3119828 RepID=UPI002FC6908A
MTTLEICVDTPAGLSAAIAGGADRIELCSALSVGGLTPSPGLMALAAKAPIPVHAMIRPRAGDFVFSDPEIAAMEADIDAARNAGLPGVVLGATHPDGALDTQTLARLIARAKPLDLTLHRAFDLAPDLPRAVDDAIALGFNRILTSGGAPRAIDGLENLKRIIAHAAGRIAIMPGSGVTPETVATFLALGITDLHASASRKINAPQSRATDLGYVTPDMKETDPALVAMLKAAMTSRS